MCNSLLENFLDLSLYGEPSFPEKNPASSKLLKGQAIWVDGNAVLKEMGEVQS